jgi:hypothetical protein
MLSSYCSFEVPAADAGAAARLRAAWADEDPARGLRAFAVRQGHLLAAEAPAFRRRVLERQRSFQRGVVAAAAAFEADGPVATDRRLAKARAAAMEAADNAADAPGAAAAAGVVATAAAAASAASAADKEVLASLRLFRERAAALRADRARLAASAALFSLPPVGQEAPAQGAMSKTLALLQRLWDLRQE